MNGCMTMVKKQAGTAVVMTCQLMRTLSPINITPTSPTSTRKGTVAVEGTACGGERISKTVSASSGAISSDVGFREGAVCVCVCVCVCVRACVRQETTAMGYSWGSSGSSRSVSFKPLQP